MTTYNAKIISTTLGVQDHGIMTFWINIEWQGGGCGYGGYALDNPGGENRVGHGHSYQAIRHILKTVGVDSWEKLPGTLIRVEDDGAGSRLTLIGHIMENKWFDIAGYMKAGEVTREFR